MLFAEHYCVLANVIGHNSMWKENNSSDQTKTNEPHSQIVKQYFKTLAFVCITEEENIYYYYFTLL